MIKPRCGDCLFFMPVPETAGQPSGGACHFSPPTPLVIGMQQVPGTLVRAQGPQVQPVIASQFPPVPADAWCGCFRPTQQVVQDA